MSCECNKKHQYRKSCQCGCCKPASGKTRPKVILFHIDDPDFSFPTKSGDIYKGMEWLWGHAVTNKALRTDKVYLYWMAPDGSIRHSHSKAQFDLLFKDNVHHSYDMEPFQLKEFLNICNRIPFLTPDQSDILRKKLKYWRR